MSKFVGVACYVHDAQTERQQEDIAPCRVSCHDPAVPPSGAHNGDALFRKGGCEARMAAPRMVVERWNIDAREAA